MRIEFLLLVIVSLALGGCASMERGPRGEIPAPESSLYAQDPEANAAYRRGFEQGYADYLKGESSLSTAYHYRSPDARSHGYSDGKIEAMRLVKNQPMDTKSSENREPYAHEEPGWFDKYGKTIESIREPKLEMNGKPLPFKWYGFE